jgi:hypothetical protein
MGLGGGASGTQGPACCGGLRHPRRKSWIVLTPYPSARSPQTIAETAILLRALRVPLRQASRSGPPAPRLVQAARRSRAGCTSVQERELTGNAAGYVVRSLRRRATLAPCPETSVSRVGACREGPTTFGAGPRRRIRAPRHVGGAAGCVIACQSYTRYRMTRPTNVQTSTSMVEPESNGWAADDSARKSTACDGSPHANRANCTSDHYKTQLRGGGR